MSINPSAPPPRRGSALQSLRPLIPLVVVALIAVAAALVIRANRGSDAADQAAIDPNQPMAISGPLGRASLNRGWTVAADPSNAGEAKGWSSGSFKGKSVDLPYSPNAKQISGSAGVFSHRGSIAWYSRKFRVTDSGSYAIDINSVNHLATVWVDGKKVKEHIGQFLPFAANVQLEPGEHTLVIKADWRNPQQMKEAGWHRTWFNFGGIDREITIRQLGKSDIAAPFVRTELQPDGRAKVTVSAEVLNRTTDRIIKLEGVIRRGGDSIPLEFNRAQVRRLSPRRVTASVVIDKPALWSTEQPNLYDVTLSVPNESGYQLRTGLREIKRDGRKMFLNGKPLQLRGASVHEDTPGIGTALRMPEINSMITELKAIGANATRAQHPLSRPLLERLDAAGIVLWQEIGPIDSPGSWTNKTAAQQKSARERAVVSLEEMQTHPSIIVWNLGNEVRYNGITEGQVPYTLYMTNLLRRRDPGRLIAIDIWGIRLPTVMGEIYKNVDAIGITNYAGWYNQPGTTMARLRRDLGIYLNGLPESSPRPDLKPNAEGLSTQDPSLMTNYIKTVLKVQTLPLTLPAKPRTNDLASYIKGVKAIFSDKVLAITEFGAEANGENSFSRPGGYGYQSEVLKTSIDVYSKDPEISGMLIWNLRDFAVAPTFIGGSIRRVYKDKKHPMRLIRGLNQKGIFTYEGRPKPSAPVVRNAFSRAAQEFAARNGGAEATP